MDNIRDGNVKVYCLKMEVRRKLDGLRKKCNNIRLAYTSRVERQIEDGERFLTMLNVSPYSNCKTVDELKQRISRKRNSLKQSLIALDPGTEGHQISIFEVIDEVSEKEKNRRAAEIEDMKAEIHWLHKCLGICKNKDYFN